MRPILAAAVLAILACTASASYTSKTLKWKGPKAVAEVGYVRFAPTNALARYANSVIEKKAQDLLAQFKLDAKEPFTSSGIDMTVSVMVHTDLPTLISVHFSNDSYLGGAHPNIEFTTMNFGLVNGKPAMLKLKDVASDRKEMLALITKAMRQELKEAQIEPSAFEPHHAEWACESFVVSREGIEFLYDGFGHAIGARTALIKWTQIKSLKRNGPLAALFRSRR